MYRRRLNNPRQAHDDVIWLELNDRGKNELYAIRDNNPQDYIQMITDIGLEMRSIQILMYHGIRRRVNTVVPRDTGALRASLLKSIDENNSLTPRQLPRNPNDLVLRMGLFSNVKYAKHVLKFKTVNLAHPKAKGRNMSFRGGGRLSDKHAKKGYMDILKRHLKLMARQLSSIMMRNLAVLWGWSNSEVRSLFVGRNYNWRGRV